MTHTLENVAKAVVSITEGVNILKRMEVVEETINRVDEFVESHVPPVLAALNISNDSPKDSIKELEKHGYTFRIVCTTYPNLKTVAIVILTIKDNEIIKGNSVNVIVKDDEIHIKGATLHVDKIKAEGLTAEQFLDKMSSGAMEEYKAERPTPTTNLDKVQESVMAITEHLDMFETANLIVSLQKEIAKITMSYLAPIFKEHGLSEKEDNTERLKELGYEIDVNLSAFPKDKALLMVMAVTRNNELLSVGTLEMEIEPEGATITVGDVNLEATNITQDMKLEDVIDLLTNEAAATEE